MSKTSARPLVRVSHVGLPSVRATPFGRVCTFADRLGLHVRTLVKRPCAEALVHTTWPYTGKGIMPCSFNDGIIGIKPSTKSVLVHSNSIRDPLVIGGILHELGHLRFPNTTEYDFFGWEYEAARAANVMRQWLVSCRDYVAGDDSTEFALFTKTEQKQILAERVAFARAAGFLVDFERGSPTCETRTGGRHVAL